MPVILLLSAPVDGVTLGLCEELHTRGTPYFLLDPRSCGQDYRLSWSFEEGQFAGEVQIGNQCHDLARCRSLFAYLTSWPIQNPSADGVDPSWLLTALAETFPGLCANRPHSALSNGSKPYQQCLISASGFTTPTTLITTDPEQVKQFYQECQGDVIYKSLSWVRSVVNSLDELDDQRLENVRNCPTQFQKRVRGTDVRVHVLGNRVFATEVETEALDYRYARRQGLKRSMRAVRLPDEIEQRCRKLTRSLNMVLAGIDLRRTPEGDYVCFEVNPTPGFSFYQQFTGQGMIQAVADLLERGNLD